MKLDIACGANCIDGFDGVDIVKVNNKVKHVVNILSFPWTFNDETVDEIHNSHFVEHLPQMFWNPDPIGPSYGESWTRHLSPFQIDGNSVELLLKFFAECWRILKPGGSMRVLCPHGHSDRIFQDSSHRRVIVQASFDYLDHEWRKANGLQHAAYGVRCHFPTSLRKTGATGSPEQVKALSLMADVVQDAAVQRYWNMVSDFDVTLTKSPIPVDQTKIEAESPKETAQAQAQVVGT